MIKVTFFRTLGNRKIRTGHMQFPTMAGMQLFMSDGAKQLTGYTSFVIHDGTREHTTVEAALAACTARH